MRLGKANHAKFVRDVYTFTETMTDIISLKEQDTNNLEEEIASLGIQWHIKKEAFSIKIEFKDRPKS